MKRILLLSCLLTLPAAAQDFSFDDAAWTIQAEEQRIEEYLGRPALFLRNGSAMLEQLDFRDGTLEFDIAFEKERGFSGVAFHNLSDGDFENFYLRPHQSGHADATQYQPVYHGNTAWQLYYGASYAAPIEHRFGAWQHVKILVQVDRAEIYVDSDEPVLCVRLQRNQPGGAVGLHSAFAPAYFANFRVELSTPRLQCTPVAPEEPVAGTIARWEISSAFAEAQLDGAFELDAAGVGELTWSELEIGDRGLANLGRLHARSEGNTVLARFSIESDAVRVVPIELAFSDRAKVYVNGRLLYSGKRNYQLMDERFLGTAGFHDSVYARLDAGRNVVTIAVSEDFGGWGVGARIASREGIRIASGS